MITFSVHPPPTSAKSSFPMSITILQKVTSPNVLRLAHLQQSVFSLSAQDHQHLQSLNAHTFYVKIQKLLTDKDWTPGVIYVIQRNFYGLLETPDLKYKDIESATESSMETPHQRPNPEIPLWELTQDLLQLYDASNFSMKPPSTVSTEALSPESNSDPVRFLATRYFTILYSLSTPLSYFPKTSLTRLKNFCAHSPDKIRSCLLELFLTVDDLEQRHGDKYGLSDGEKSAIFSQFSSIEVQHQKMFTDKNNIDNSNPDRVSTFILELKVREAQLQLLILLELLLLLDEAAFIEECSKKQEKEFTRKKKPSLVRRKSKKVVPTFLGMAVDPSLIKSPIKTPLKSEYIDNYSLFTCLNTLVDRMSIWDTLLGKGQGDDSSYGFLAYVLVPYFNRKLPVTIKFIIDKFKALNSKFVSKNKKVPKEKRKKYTKVPLDADKKPTLQSTKTDDDLLPAFSLKRSKSNLSSRNLLKRQVDMSVSKSTSDLQEPESNKIIFGDARKIKSQSIQEKKKEDIMTQVQATPAKRSNTTMIRAPAIMATPAKRSVSEKITALATPSQARTTTVFATPRQNLHAPVLSTPAAITSSPITSPVQEKINQTVITSPIKTPVVSSKKRKPGEPVSVMESPFYSTRMAGSPGTYDSVFQRASVKKFKASEDTDEDSDQEISPKKIKTYGKRK